MSNPEMKHQPVGPGKRDEGESEPGPGIAQAKRPSPLPDLEFHILDSVEQAVIATDTRGNILYWNPYAEQLYGWSSAEVLGRNVVDVTPGEMSQAQAADIMEHLGRGEKWSGEFLVRRRDGSTFWAHVTDSPIVNQAGELVAIVGFSVDITGRKRMEEQLRESAETIETINNIGQLLSAELDLEKLVQLVTDQATQLTGAKFGAFFYTALDEKGMAYQLYTLSGAPREAFAQYPMPRPTSVFGPTFRGEGVVRSGNIREDPRYGHNAPYQGMPPGHLPVTSYLAVPVVSRSGTVVGGLFFGHPEPNVFTERAERIVVGIAAQTAIALDNARLYDQAQQAIRDREHFLSMAAHELRTPVTSVAGYAGLLQHRLERDEVVSGKNKQAARSLVAQVQRLRRLVDTLFDLSRLHLGQLTLERGFVDVPDLVAQTVAAVEPIAERHSVCFESSWSPGTLFIEGDAVRLEQAVANLLHNAIKYSPDGGEIRVTVERQDNVVGITVSDQGMGIPAEALPHLFNRFYRADNAIQTHISGLGMGLYLVKEIAMLHGGTIEVESTESQGTTFRLLLPLL